MADVVHVLTLAHASKIVDEALAAAHSLKLGPMSVAVLDAGGHLVAFKREDNSSILRFEVAFGKAWGALGMGRPSRGLEQTARDRPHFADFLAAASGGRMVALPGGALIRNSEGRVIGGVGVTGDTADADEICAVRAIKAAGLISEPDQEPERQ